MRGSSSEIRDTRENRVRDSKTLKGKLPDVLGMEIANIIEERIIYLDIPPGTHVTEQEVSDEFGVSRSPVREAFRQLESSGLVVRLARRGIRVNRMTQEDLNEIYTCRIVLEGLAASSAAINASEEDLSRMKMSLDNMATALENRNVADFFENNVLFQQEMHNASGNNMLMRILAVMEKHALRYRYLAHSRTNEMLEFSYDAQRAVYQAIEAHDPKKAKKRATNMMRRSLRLIGKILSDDSEGANSSK